MFRVFESCSRRTRHRNAALAWGLVVVVAGGRGLAFCRTSVCSGKGTSQLCTPPTSGDCGIPLYWPDPCVGFSVQKNASRQVSFSAAETTLRQAFDTWMNAPCTGGKTPRLAVVEALPVTCDRHEYNKTTGNANIILFRDEKWPHNAALLALTTVTYDLDTGAIYDADMELNAESYDFTVGDAKIETDLLSVVTHEAGHFLGLAHAQDVDTVMFPAYVPQSIAQRSLSADDIAGICAIYPPGDMAATCDPIPRNGFSAHCADDGTEKEVTSSGYCAVAPVQSYSDISGAFAAWIGFIVLTMRRMRNSPKRPRLRH